MNCSSARRQRAGSRSSGRSPWNHCTSAAGRRLSLAAPGLDSVEASAKRTARTRHGERSHMRMSALIPPLTVRTSPFTLHPSRLQVAGSVFGSSFPLKCCCCILYPALCCCNLQHQLRAAVAACCCFLVRTVARVCCCWVQELLIAHTSANHESWSSFFYMHTQ